MQEHPLQVFPTFTSKKTNGFATGVNLFLANVTTS